MKDDDGRRSMGILQAHLVSLTAQVSQKEKKIELEHYFYIFYKPFFVKTDT